MKIKIFAILSSVFVISVGITLIILLYNKAVGDQKANVKEIALSKAYSLQKQIDLSVSSTLALASYINEHETIDDFDSVANGIRKIYRVITILQLAPNGIIKYLSPITGYESALGVNVFQDPQRRKDALDAVKTRSLVITGPIKLRDGNIGIIARCPIFKTRYNEEYFWGFSAAVVYLHDLLQESGIEKLKDSGYNFALFQKTSPYRDSIFFSSLKTNVQLEDYVIARIEVQNGVWYLALKPVNGWSNSSALFFEIGFVLLTGLLVFNFVYVLLKQPQKLRDEVKVKTREAREVASRLESLIKNMKGGILFEDAERKVRLVNNSFLNMFDIDAAPSEFIGKAGIEAAENIMHLITEPQKFIDDISSAVNIRKEVICTEIQLINREFLERDYIPIFISESFNGHLWIYRDITEQKKAQKEILNALEQEKELNQLKSRFVSMTSHEFRTPLATILASAEMLEHYSDKWDNEKILKHLKRIQNSSTNMTDLLNNVLTLSKIEAGKLGFNPDWIDPEKYFTGLVEEINLSSPPGKHVELSMNIQCEKAYMDEKLLQQIFSNLLSNAVKYTPEGKNIYIKIHCNSDNKLIAEIIDEGIGIPEHEQIHLFSLSSGLKMFQILKAPDLD